MTERQYQFRAMLIDPDEPARAAIQRIKMELPAIIKPERAMPEVSFAPPEVCKQIEPLFGIRP